jgi:hypothetical protein
MKRMVNSKKQNSASEISNVSNNLFEPDVHRKEEENEFYKSNQNFFMPEKENNINHINANNKDEEIKNKEFDIDFIKKELDESNRINSYLMNKEKDIEKAHETNFKANNLSEYFTKKDKDKLDDDFNLNYDEISVESLNSDDDKF